MSFTVKIQRMSSEAIKVTKDVSTILELQGYLRDGSSIIDPVILIEDTVGLGVLNVANYMEIPSFGRKYFIGDIVSVRTGLIQISGHVDVLSSFSGDLLLNKGIVFRQENDWNLYLNDGVLEMYQNPIVVTKTFEHGFEGKSYVLALAGRRGRVTTAGSGGTTLIAGSGTVIGSGAGATTTGPGAKTCSGLVQYANAHIGCPYWWGTFGTVASQALLAYKLAQYPEWYSPKQSQLVNDFGQQVFDCVGLIKGYRWDDGTGDPAYVADQDWDAEGMFNHCAGLWGTVSDTDWTSTYSLYPGVLLFQSYNGRIVHVGVSNGDGTVTHCTYPSGVVNETINTTIFSMYGIPDWLRVSGSSSAV